MQEQYAGAEELFSEEEPLSEEEGMPVILHKGKNLMDLEMGLVESCFVIADKSQKELWLSRDFVEYRDYPIFLADLDEQETVFLGIPATLEEFGAENLTGAAITSMTCYGGTYGMGGPGFTELSLQKDSEHLRLCAAIWAAGEYILLDQKVLESHPCYYEEYDPWIQDHQTDITLLDGYRINGITLTQDECTIILEKDGKNRELKILKNSDQLPPMGNGEPRKDAYKEGNLADHLLIIYEDCILAV